MQERTYEGIPVSAGIGAGRVHLLTRTPAMSHEPSAIDDSEIEAEVQRFRAAIDLSREQLEKIRRQVAEAIDDKHAEIITAQMLFLGDIEVVDKTIDDIRREKKNAEFLFNRRIDELIQMMSRFDDEFLRARDSDIFDVAHRVTNNLLQATASLLANLAPDSVIVAHDLAPSETAALIREHVAAFVLEKGGPTSHTAIMAKALEIPAVVGVANITSYIDKDTPIIVDGLTGHVITNPKPETIEYYRNEQVAFTELEKELELLLDQLPETLDGYSIRLRANIELPEELEHAAKHGARGIGLFRTEFLYMNRAAPPSEDEQFEIYRHALEVMHPHSVVFRTLDLGGDKFFSNVPMAPDINPFMGQRAIRFCLQQPDIFHPQLRAMLRASAYGRTRILIPMISGLEEFLEVKRHLRQVKEELKTANIEFDPNVELGAMIEVPSAAVVADTLATEADFFSIGTNDLIQYTLAVDRGNEKVAYLYEPLHPAILRLIRAIISAGHESGIMVCVCGEMASDPTMAIILLGMGVDELSMSAVSVPSVKKLIRSIRLSEAKLLAEEILGQPTIDGVKQIVRRRLKIHAAKQKMKKFGPQRPA
ncbi:MAG: phosphoenolpyruvate--protein phosphotransferase [Candidatus Sumerlaeota bacterium]|nr:phosphoenolpyruvate--protein phosphotransferase [Candidatus Sumerlaeota bacterium]